MGMHCNSNCAHVATCRLTSCSPQAEELLAREPLPPCLIPGNVDTAGDRCVLGDKLRELAVGAQVGG